MFALQHACDRCQLGPATQALLRVAALVFFMQHYDGMIDTSISMGHTVGCLGLLSFLKRPCKERLISVR